MWFIIAIATIFATIFYSRKKNNFIYVIYKTLPRDIKAGIRFAKLNILLWKWEREQQTVVKVFSSLVKKHPQKVAFYFEDEVWTYKKVDEFSNKVASYFKKEGFSRGDTIALLLENRPEYVCFWLGLSKIGVVTALINTNLVNDPLQHSVTIANSSAIIYGSDYTKAIKGLTENLPKLKLYQYSTTSEAELLPEAINLHDMLKDVVIIDSISQEISKGTPRDKLVYIYTSGTTGLPKPAVITNIRFIFMAAGVHYMTTIRPDDVIYDPLPLYHSAGGMVGVGQVLLKGTTIAIRKKFSASNYWKDCNKYRCTVAQYIGEICRYLIATHENNKDITHNVRAMFGNGLRPQIWVKFVNTFNIKELFEFYGATEGNSNLINIDNTPGAVGFVPRYVGFLYPVSLIKCNEATGEPIRDRNGYCIYCQPHEPGVFVGKINPKKAVHAFAGYADEKATQKKIIRNVFKTGDIYFNSGDILVYDELGNYYFKDRTGDTFRWKGENVATSEVEAVISNVVELNDAVVYGVQIPETEGRAGMAAIVDANNTVDTETLCKRLKANLPGYAIPLFLRIMDSVPITGTFKLKKTDLQKEGFNVDIINDKLYFYDAKKGTYCKLTSDIYNDIISGKVRL